jgi:hypothetical protein
MLRLCDEHGFRLAGEFFWHNPTKLPSPIEWVNKRKIRAKDSVNTVWCFAKTDFPKADVRRVLAPYPERMKKLLEDAETFYRPKLRPSGHDISSRFASDNGGAIPSNLLQIPNTESNSPYLRHCASAGVKPHPARFPEKLPTFFIEFLTDPGDTVLDIFAGSNTTGSAAEKLDRVVSENSCISIRTRLSLCSKASSTEMASENIARGLFHCDTTISRTKSPPGDNPGSWRPKRMGLNWHSLRATSLGWRVGLTTRSSHRFCLAGTLKNILRNGLSSGVFRRVARVFGHYGLEVFTFRISTHNSLLCLRYMANC